MDVVVLLLVASATALATGIGAVPVFMLGVRAQRLQPLLTGVAMGVMGVASLVGLLLPAFNEGSAGSVVLGLVLGVAFLVLARRAIGAREIHVGQLTGGGVRTAVLVFLVLLVHSLPEGFAIGTAYASDTTGLALFVIVAIAVQNVPEGTSVAIPMQGAGFSEAQQFWAAVGTSAPQPVGALIAFALIEQIRGLLAVSFAFAAGAMIALIVIELAPQALNRTTWRAATAGIAMGAAVMLVLSYTLGV